MSTWLVALVGLVYAAISIQQFRAGNMSMCVVFAGYAFSNAGLMLAVK